MRANAGLAAVVTATLLPLFFAHQSAADTTAAAAPVTLEVTPDRLEVPAGQPCLPRAPLTVGMTNTGAEAVFADSFLRADAGLTLSRWTFSSYVPAGDELSVPVTVRAAPETEPGEYDVTLRLGQEEPDPPQVRVPIEVTAPPDKTVPGTNLLLGEAATPSSTYVTAATAFSPCGGVDGDRTWSTTTAWNAANRGDFPDTYTVDLPEPVTMNRVDLYTAQSASSRPETHGLRDWDVQVRAGSQWQTVAEVRGNVEWLTSSTFEPVETDAVRIVGLASNRGDYSRIAELEAYYDEPADE